jgi:hypothetical protein
MTNNTPYLRKKIPTLLVFSATAIALLLLTSTLLPISNILLQPVQATVAVPTSVRTDSPVNLEMLCSSAADAALTFNATGTPSSSDPRTTVLTGGTFQITNSSSNGGQILWSGSFYAGTITADPKVTWYVDIYYSGDGQGSVCGNGGGFLEIQTSCPGGEYTTIALNNADYDPIGTGTIYGTVDCDTGGDTTTAQPSSSSSSSSSPMTGTTTQSRDMDGDGDGILDSSDRCTHNSNPRCFKEGDTSSGTTTHDQQQPSSSSSSSGNQTTTTQERQQPSSNRTGNQTR